jgi:3-oxoacyl-[acyl-carrier protein] reductase
VTDMWLEVSRRKAARRAVQALGLPLPLPHVLERGVGPWARRELVGRAVGVVGFASDALGNAVAHVVGESGAGISGTMHVPFQRASEAFGIPRAPLDGSLHAVLVDATALETIDQLRAGPSARTNVSTSSSTAATTAPWRTSGATGSGAASWFEELQLLVRRIAASGRLVVFAADAADEGAEAAGVAAALEGFVRSAAKEIGRRGATANVVVVEAGAEAHAAAVARFLLSPRSAFVTAQPIRATRNARTPRVGAADADAATERSNVGLAGSNVGLSRLDAATNVATFVGALDRKIAVVTGASRGIGEATARRLAEEGAHVVCVDRPAEERQLAAVARSIGGEVYLADVAASDKPAALAAFLRERHGGVDIVVHNAGITRDRTFAKMSDAEWNAVLDVNLRAVVAINDALLGKTNADEKSKSDNNVVEKTKSELNAGDEKNQSDPNCLGGRFQSGKHGALLRDGGRIICLSSVAGIAGNVGQTAYAASKAGLIGYVRALAGEVAARGVTVNAVAPGFIETRMTAAIPFAIREAGRRLAALGQGGLPIDVAEAIVFLAQPAAVGVSGAVLRVCGGALIGA